MLIDQLDETTVTWKVYMQALPADRKTVEYWPLDADGKVVAKLSAQKHDPFVYFSRFTRNPDRMAKLLPRRRLRRGSQGRSRRLHLDFAGSVSRHARDFLEKRRRGRRAQLRLSGLRARPFRDPVGDDYLRQTVEAIRSSSVWKDDTVIILV